MKEKNILSSAPADPYGEEGLALLREAVREYMTEKRYLHTLGVERKAAELAARHAPEKTAKLRAAALLHDITKERSAEEQIALCARFSVPVPRDCLESPKLFHSLTKEPMTLRTNSFRLLSRTFLVSTKRKMSLLIIKTIR